MTARWARFARGWIVAGFSTFVAALSHTLGGGHAPGFIGVVLSLAFAGVLCVGLSGRAVAQVRVTVSVVLSQLVFHGLFSVGAAGGALAPSSGSFSGAHQHQPVGILAPGESSAAVGALGAHGDWMWASHAVAAVVTVLALRHGEAALRRILTLTLLAIRRLVQPAVDVPVPSLHVILPPAFHGFTRGDAVELDAVLRRRGPPVSFARVA